MQTFRRITQQLLADPEINRRYIELLEQGISKLEKDPRLDLNYADLTNASDIIDAASQNVEVIKRIGICNGSAMHDIAVRLGLVASKLRLMEDEHG